MEPRSLLALKALASTVLAPGPAAGGKPGLAALVAGPARRRLSRGLYAPELLESRIAPATFTVTSLLDNGLDGTLRKEIADANLLIGADTIVFKLTDPLLPHTITLNTATGEIPITGPLTIKGPGIDLLAISGSDLIRIFNIDDGVGATLSPTTISGLTFTDGKSASDGGAVYSVEPLSLKNVVIRSSSAADGGGIAVKTVGKISIVGSRIVHNVASSDSGGLYLRGDGGISIIKTTVADNTAASSAGGFYASVNSATSVILVDSCIIANNTATGGAAGGLQLVGANETRITVKNSLITGNSAGTEGGGLYLSNGKLSIAKTTFSNNSAKVGGGLVSDNGQALTISSSRFLGNRATDGALAGGGAIYLEGPGIVKITGSLFSGNDSAINGGAIANVSSITMDITGSSFLGNTAEINGGAIFVTDAAVLTLKGSILTGNAAARGGAIHANKASVLNLTGNQFSENGAVSYAGGALFTAGLAADAVTATLSGNLFQGNVAELSGGAVHAQGGGSFTSKGDKFIGNVALTGQGGGVYLINSGGIFLTSSLVQGNVAGSSGGGALIGASATLTSLKVLDNIAGAGGLGGGLRISAGTVMIFKSLITGNVANEEGGGILFNVGTTTIDAATKVIGNVARTNPNIGTI